MLAGKGRIGVMFSGGYDSEVLLRAAVSAAAPEGTVSLTAASPLLAGYYRRRIRGVARELRLEPVFAEVDLPGIPAFRSNGADRCYICKRAICERLRKEAAERGCAVLMDGTSVDDLSEDRPGLAAAFETGIEHPFVEAGMGRREIACLGRSLGTLEEEHPSDSCLATRIRRGTPVTVELLELVETLEAPLRPLVRRRFRVRVEDRCLAVEYSAEDEELIMGSLDAFRTTARMAGFQMKLEGPED